MSLIQDLGARLNAANADLPLGEVTAALDKLRATSALLAWVRQQSVNPMGVPELAGAIEHLEHAMAALHVAEDSVTGYLAAIGLGTGAARPPSAGAPPPQPPPATDATGTGPPIAPRLRQWWAERVAFLTDGDVAPDAGSTSTTSDELLREVARRTGAGDRDGLRRTLEAAPAPVGLGLAALTPAVLQRLATELLGHEPAAADLPTLTRTAREPVLALLPKLPPQLVDTMLARVCRVPPPPADGTPPHPADTAVTSGVLVGVLLRRLGHDPQALAVA